MGGDVVLNPLRTVRNGAQSHIPGNCRSGGAENPRRYGSDQAIRSPNIEVMEIYLL